MPTHVFSFCFSDLRIMCQSTSQSTQDDGVNQPFKVHVKNESFFQKIKNQSKTKPKRIYRWIELRSKS